MAACPTCGASIEGDLCSKCGALVVSKIFAPAASKKNRTLYWILGGCLILGFTVMLIVVSAGIYFVYMAKNPVHTVAKEIVNLDPNLEIISTDEETGIVRMRYKKTGLIIRMNVKDGRNAKSVINEIQNNGMGVSPQSVTQAWIPVYPNKKSDPHFSVALDEKSGSCILETNDSAERVAAFYENAFTKAGFTIKVYKNKFDKNGRIVAKEINGKRKAYVSTRITNKATQIYIEFNLGNN